MKHLLVTAILALTVLSVNAQSSGPKELTCTETAVTLRFNVSKNLRINKVNLGSPDLYRPLPQAGRKKFSQEEYDDPKFVLFPNRHIDSREHDSLSSAPYLFKPFSAVLPGQHALSKKGLTLFTPWETESKPGNKTFNSGFALMPFQEVAY